MALFVSDASVVLARRFADEATPFTEGLLDRLAQGEEAAVPTNWPLEVLNGLIQGKRRGRVSEVEIRRFIADLSSFHIVVDADTSFARLTLIRDLAERNHLTSYDAAYLELAMRLNLPLASLDQDLLKAAQSEGLEVV
jgi:predicted nucleic acid-binding protein